MMYGWMVVWMDGCMDGWLCGVWEREERKFLIIN